MIRHYHYYCIINPTLHPHMYFFAMSHICPCFSLPSLSSCVFILTCCTVNTKHSLWSSKTWEFTTNYLMILFSFSIHIWIVLVWWSVLEISAVQMSALVIKQLQEKKKIMSLDRNHGLITQHKPHTLLWAVCSCVATNFIGPTYTLGSTHLIMGDWI